MVGNAIMKINVRNLSQFNNTTDTVFVNNVIKVSELVLSTTSRYFLGNKP
jgi:hypothetical protein